MINKGPSHSNQLTNHHKPPANYSQTNQSTINNNIITTITTINNNTIQPLNINNNNQLPQPHHQSTVTNNPTPQIHPSSFPFLIWVRPKNNIFYNSNCLFIWLVKVITTPFLETNDHVTINHPYQINQYTIPILFPTRLCSDYSQSCV